MNNSTGSTNRLPVLTADPSGVKKNSDSPKGIAKRYEKIRNKTAMIKSAVKRIFKTEFTSY
jgi:hypothetical protein